MNQLLNIHPRQTLQLIPNVGTFLFYNVKGFKSYFAWLIMIDDARFWPTDMLKKPFIWPTSISDYSKVFVYV